MESFKFCSNCADTVPTFKDSHSGATICGQCYAVLEDNTIVSEVTFSETGGRSAADGQFVSNMPGRRGAMGGSSVSREQAIARARVEVEEIASQLGLSNETTIERAVKMYMSALQFNFTKGRRLVHVCAACLYIICRIDKTPHMLIDFSVATQEDMYVIGHTFVALADLLQLDLPIVDPSLYIHRFAAKLNFGDRAHAVSLTALKLVARMKRDWIEVGRRPAGVCAAALMIAAKVHGFERSHLEIVRVVRICEITLRKRLAEFERTPTAALTAEEFDELNVEEDHDYVGMDPPAFTRNRRMEEAEEAAQDNAARRKGKKRRRQVESSDEESVLDTSGQGRRVTRAQTRGSSAQAPQEASQQVGPSEVSVEEPELGRMNVEKALEAEMENNEIQLLEKDMIMADMVEEEYQRRA